MAKVDRVKLIKELEKEQKTRIVTYVTSTREGFDVSMADDCIRLIYDHLREINKDGQCAKISLFIYSNGGSGVVPWRLVNLLRENCKQLEILVPYKAYSAATLTCLGADKIIMHPMGELGPIDPSVANMFNPPDDKPIDQKKRINVEDVSSYVAFIKDDLGITHQDEMVQAFNILAEKVHPLALGNVKRFHSQSEMIARKLLKKHMLKKEEEHKMTEIVKMLKSKLFFHGHPINRVEAEEIGLKVENAAGKTEELMWTLYLNYEKELKLNTPFDPAILLHREVVKIKDKIARLLKEKFDLEKKLVPNLAQNQAQVIQADIHKKTVEINEAEKSLQLIRIDTGVIKGAYIESAHLTDVFQAEGEISHPAPNQVRIEWHKKGWVRE